MNKRINLQNKKTRVKNWIASHKEEILCYSLKIGFSVGCCLLYNVIDNHFNNSSLNRLDTNSFEPNTLYTYNSSSNEKIVPIDAYKRKLPKNYKASSEKIKTAKKYGFDISDGKHTYVKPHNRTYA